ncbi:AzlD domain-containing protein [Pseudosulfitobacter sp. SM2401]|uniref:AzlD domain-containing protein n=1 Tax=Pseudosulfitobacter sp. SM2401 TaxID=3350098 RepID=UPI0036F1D2FF
MIDKSTLWTVIILLGVGSFALRFSFLGLVGDRPMPAWLVRSLRYTAVAILPAMIAPLIAFSNDAGTGPDPSRLAAALMTLIVGAATKNVILALFTGASTLGIGLYFFG